MADPLVTGTLRAEGERAAGAEVQLFARASGGVPALRLLASDVTDAHGAFTLDRDGGGEDLPERGIVVAKLRDGRVGALTRDVPLSAPVAVELEASGPFYSVSGTLTGDVRPPGELTIVADPVRLDGVQDDVVPFLNQRAAGVFDGRYAARTVRPPSFGLRLQRGTWRLRGEYVNLDRPNVPKPEFSNYVTAEVRREPDGLSLPGGPSAGFEVDLSSDLRLTFVLRELPDDAL